MEFNQPLTQIDIYQNELEWRILLICEEIRNFLDELETIREALEYDNSPRPPAEFDPLRTQY